MHIDEQNSGDGTFKQLGKTITPQVQFMQRRKSRYMVLYMWKILGKPCIEYGNSGIQQHKKKTLSSNVHYLYLTEDTSSTIPLHIMESGCSAVFLRTFKTSPEFPWFLLKKNRQWFDEWAWSAPNTRLTMLWSQYSSRSHHREELGRVVWQGGCLHQPSH